MNYNSKKGAGTRIISSIIIFCGAIVRFGRNLAYAFFKFNTWERFLFFLLTLTLIVLMILQGIKVYKLSTKPVPASGGEYVEYMSGEGKYFTPILAKSDAERAVSHLVYSALIRINENGVPEPDLAESWEISTDGLIYTFHLRSGVTFHQGQTFDSDDVAATVDTIQDVQSKSPLFETWKDVSVETPDAMTVLFTLPKMYGPFIYNCTFEIVDSEDTGGSLSAVYNGTGPYKFVQSVPFEKDKTEVSLKSNSTYYAGVPKINKLKFIFSEDSALEPFQKEVAERKEISAFSGKPLSLDRLSDKSFITGRNLVLFLNQRRENMKNKDIRNKIIQNLALDTKIDLYLITPDAEPQKSRAKQFADERTDKNVNINVRVLNSTDYADAVKKRDYDLLMYGYDFSYDRDPYTFWHSSQLDKNNFSGFSDKGSDIIIEDARLILDSVERNKRYDQFYQIVKDQALAVYFDAERYPYYVSSEVKGQNITYSGRPEDRFNGILDWYMKEKRVKK